MSEELIAFHGHGLRLYGMLHRPEGTEACPAVMLLHGLTGERCESHRIFVKLARRLASAGVAALRFDFCGSGESEGDFADVTISRWVDDALTGLDWLSQLPGIDAERLGVLGLSMGGTTAAVVAGQRGDQVKALVLWSAAADPERAIHGWLQRAKPGVVGAGYDVGGNLLGQGFMLDVGAIHPTLELAHYCGQALIVQGIQDSIVPFTDADLFASALAGRARKHMVSGADHTFTSVAWEREVLDATAEFLQSVFFGIRTAPVC